MNSLLNEILNKPGTAGGNGSGGALGWRPTIPHQATAGLGILASEGNTTITNRGTINGGGLYLGHPLAGGTLLSNANAITFSGSGNILILEDDYSFTGNIVGGGAIPSC